MAAYSDPVTVGRQVAQTDEKSAVGMAVRSETTTAVTRAGTMARPKAPRTAAATAFALVTTEVAATAAPTVGFQAALWAAEMDASRVFQTVHKRVSQTVYQLVARRAERSELTRAAAKADC